MELDTAILGPGRLIVQTNKIHHVFTIDRVARGLGEDEEWLADIANEMEPEDGLIWVYNLRAGGVIAFTDFGIENLRELILIHRDRAK